MKKTLFVLFLIPILLFSGCFLFKSEAQTIVMEEQGLDISDAKVNFFINTRKDSRNGITMIEAEFSDDGFEDQLSGKEGFKTLPFSEGLTNILNSIDLLKDENGELLIPYAVNGFYSFDLLLEEGKEITEEQAAELIVAIYDGDTKKFHYSHFSIDNINLLSKLQGLIEQ